VLCRAGHPGHLISFVETDLEAYSLSNLQPFLGASYSEMRLPDLRVSACKGCDAMRCGADTSMAMPFDAFAVVRVQLPGTRMRESHCSPRPLPVHSYDDGNAG